MTTYPVPTQADIERVVRIVVDACSPERIVLFGSSARGEQGDGSDIDLLVVVPDVSDRVRLAGDLHVLMYRERVTIPVNFVVTTAEAFARNEGNPGTIYPAISREGREVYAAA